MGHSHSNEAEKRFSCKELDLLRKSFKDLAQRSPGKTIDKETFLKFFPLPGLHGERLFHVYDTKHTGVIDFEEFITGLSISMKGTFDEKVSLLFKLYDIDNHENVSKDELRTMLNQIPGGALQMLITDHDRTDSQVAMVDKLVDDAFEHFKLNNEGHMSPGQFRDWVKFQPAVLTWVESLLPFHEPQSESEILHVESCKDLSNFESSGLGSGSDASWVTTTRERTSSHATLSSQRSQRHGSADSGMFTASPVKEDDIASPSGVDFTGTLYKLGRRVKSYRARMYILRGNVLFYFYLHRMDKPAGVIFLNGCFVVEHDQSCTGNKSGRLSPVSARRLRSDFSDIKFSQGCADSSTHSSKRSRGNGVDCKNEHHGLYGFEIITSQGGERDSRVLFAKSHQERVAWMNAIRNASEVEPFHEKYERLDQIGKGKFALVFKCVRKSGKQEPLAVKIIDKRSLNEEEKGLLQTEIAILKLVNHVNIVHLEDLFESLNHIYIVQDYVQGGELYHHIVGRPRLSELESFPIVYQLASAVQYLHVLGVCHRDIKPENILCCGSKDKPLGGAILKLCDFGLSKLVTPESVMKLACGTLSYVAPEVLAMNGYGKAADIWNIGVILYLVRRGRLPFDGETKQDVIFSTLYTKLDYANDAIFSKASPLQISLLQGMLEKDPQKRLTAKEILAHPWMVEMEAQWTSHHPRGSPDSQFLDVDHSKEVCLHTISAVGAIVKEGLATQGAQSMENGLQANELPPPSPPNCLYP